MNDRVRLILASAACMVAAPAMAQTTEPRPAATDNATLAAAPFDTAVDADTLGTITGKADLSTVISAKNTSNVSNNSVTGNSVTGSIAFDQSSFSGLNGLSLLSANTGNNVAINSSLNVNVVIRP